MCKKGAGLECTIDNVRSGRKCQTKAIEHRIVKMAKTTLLPLRLMDLLSNNQLATRLNTKRSLVEISCGTQRSSDAGTLLSRC